MSQLVVVVRFELQKGKTDEAIAAFAPVVANSPDELGFVQCDLRRDVDDPDILLLIEQWKTEADYRQHLGQDLVQRSSETVLSLLARLPTVTVSTAVEVGPAGKHLI